MSKLAPEHVQHSLHGIAEKVMGAEWRVIGRLLEHWPVIVGASMAEHASPSNLIPARGVDGKEQAKLVVRIPGALAPQFQMQEGLMLERINALLGYAYVVRIIFEHKTGE